ncbi:hypothetical protein ACJX0J_035475, partial [Zea mays]
LYMVTLCMYVFLPLQYYTRIRRFNLVSSTIALTFQSKTMYHWGFFFWKEHTSWK